MPFRGLTCDFWAENEKNKCNGKSKGKILGFSLRSKNDSRDLQRQRQRQMRGFFAALRMTAELATTTAKAEAKTKADPPPVAKDDN
jgi:hypothetical protein